jgi:NAD+-dependent protein deacetylase SIR2
VRKQKVAECKLCDQRIKEQLLQLPRPGMKRKRSSNGTNKAKKWNSDFSDDDDDEGQYDIPQPGVMKPDITFFGEALPSHFFARLRNEDRDRVDLVIVMGTSMKVAPVSEIPQFIPPNVPQIYISRDVSFLLTVIA